MIYNRYLIFFALLLLASSVVIASGEKRFFTEKIAYELLDYRDFERKIYFELDAPFDLCRIRQLSVGDGKSKISLGADHFRIFGWPDMHSVRVTSSSKDKSVIYVRIPFLKNNIDDPEIKGRRCSLVVIIKDYQFIYGILSVEVEDVNRSYFYVPDNDKPTKTEDIKYLRYSELSVAQKQLMDAFHGD